MSVVITRWLRCAVLLCLAVPSLASAAPARQRPIEDFVSRQGTYCVQLAPPACFLAEAPVGNLLGWMKWTDGYRRFARVDYAGLVDRYLEANGLPTWGTTSEGSITERPLADGTAEVTVRLHTRRAPAWVTYRAWTDNGDGVGASSELSGPTLKAWGHTAAELAAGATPSLVDIQFHLVFIAPAMGAPMPDMLQFSFDPVYLNKRLFISITAHGAGDLAVDAPVLGLGEPGDPADLVLHQVGLLEIYANLPDAAAKPAGHEGIWNNQGWPSEILELTPIAVGE